MEETSGEIVYPRLEQIIDTNRQMIKKFGGFFLGTDNLINRSSIEYILDAIESNISGIELYSTIKEKACAVAYYIISRHVFNDGNKRTATQVALEFLRANSVNIFIDESIIDLAVEIAKGKAEEKELLNWLHEHQ